MATTDTPVSTPFGVIWNMPEATASPEERIEALFEEASYIEQLVSDRERGRIPSDPVDFAHYEARLNALLVALMIVTGQSAEEITTEIELRPAV